MTEEVNAGRLMDFCLSIKLCKLENPLTITARYEYERTFRQLVKLQISHFQEKFRRTIFIMSVLRTNTRGQGEYPKASEKTIVKELCKMTP